MSEDGETGSDPEASSENEDADLLPWYYGEDWRQDEDPSDECLCTRFGSYWRRVWDQKTTFLSFAVKTWEMALILGLAVAVGYLFLCTPIDPTIVFDSSSEVGPGDSAPPTYTANKTVETKFGIPREIRVICEPTKNVTVVEETAYACEYQGGLLGLPGSSGLRPYRPNVSSFVSVRFESVKGNTSYTTKQIPMINGTGIVAGGSPFQQPNFFKVRAPPAPGRYRLDIDIFSGGSDLSPRQNRSFRVYSVTEKSTMEYRKRITPFDQLVVLGIIFGSLQLSLTLLARIEEKRT